MDVYIQPKQKVDLHNKNSIKLIDIADIVCPNELKNKLSQLELLKIDGSKKSNYIIAVSDIVDKIIKVSPDSTVNNLGEKEILIDYKPDIKQPNKFLEFLKIASVSTILLVGSSTAIMSFQSEAQILKVFINYYRIFLGVQTDKPVVLSVAYSFGLCFGIMVFFNHFFSKNMTDDPTPIEVEMSTYEEDVTRSIIDTLNSQEKKNAHN